MTHSYPYVQENVSPEPERRAVQPGYMSKLPATPKRKRRKPVEQDEAKPDQS